MVTHERARVARVWLAEGGGFRQPTEEELARICSVPWQPDADGFLGRRDHGDREIFLVPLTFGRAAVAIGRRGDLGYEDYWQYDDALVAAAAFLIWDPEAEPEPRAWVRHPASGRRRPGGEAAKEHRRP